MLKWFKLSALLIVSTLLCSNISLSAEAELFTPSSTSTLSSELNRSLSSSQQPLPNNEAFILTLRINQQGTPVLGWKIHDGYYLYRKSLSIESEQMQDIVFNAMPEGELIEDEFFGQVEIYKNQLELEVALTNTNREIIEINVSYQGCAQNLYCYPMQSKALSVFLGSAQ